MPGPPSQEGRGQAVARSSAGYFACHERARAGIRKNASPATAVIKRYVSAVLSFPKTIVARRPSFTYVRGSTRATDWRKGGIDSRGKNEPARNIMGNPTAFATAAAVSVSLTYRPKIIPRDVNSKVPATMSRMAVGVRTTDAPHTTIDTTTMRASGERMGREESQLS